MFGFRPGLLLSDFNVSFQSTVIGVNPVIVAPANPDRFALVFFASPINGYFVSPMGQQCSQTTCFQSITATPAVLTFTDFGPLVGLQWQAEVSAGAATVNVCSILYQPKGGDLSAAKTLKLPNRPKPQSSVSHLLELLNRYSRQTPTAIP